MDKIKRLRICRYKSVESFVFC